MILLPWSVFMPAVDLVLTPAIACFARRRLRSSRRGSPAAGDRRILLASTDPAVLHARWRSPSLLE